MLGAGAWNHGQWVCKPSKADWGVPTRLCLRTGHVSQRALADLKQRLGPKLRITQHRQTHRGQEDHVSLMQVTWPKGLSTNELINLLKVSLW